MGKLLEFFGAGPARLQALLIGALAMALTCAALAGWALVERSGRLTLKIEVVRLEGQVTVLADKLKTQNDAVDAFGKAGDRIVGDVKKQLASLAKNDGRRSQQIASIEALLRQPRPTGADGRPAGCSDAWRRIEAQVRP